LSTITIARDVADILSRATIKDNLLVLPPGQLARATYEAVNKVLATLGGKWNRKARGHLFAGDPTEVLADALCIGSVLDTKRAYEQFWTPPDVARRMAEYAVDSMSTVLEPSGGSGWLVEAALEEGAEILAVEIDPRQCDKLRELGDDVSVIEADFLEWTRTAPADFDAVLMNPPFSKNQDITHVRAAWDLLRPGGRLAAIISPHSSFANDRPSIEFREWLDEIGLDVDERLESGTFKDAGTMVGARLIMAIKQ
jgi:predicted RNA methylase